MAAATAAAIVATALATQNQKDSDSTTEDIHLDYWKYHANNNPLSTRIIFTTLCALTFVVGVVGNTLVVVTVAKDKKMHTVTNYFIVNLAVADLLVLLFCVPASVVPVYLYGWHLGSALCKFVPFIQSVTISVSVNSMAAISFDRYLAICQVFEFHVTRNMARLMIIGLWIVASVIFIPFLITYRIKETVGYRKMQTCIQDWPAFVYEWIYFVTAEFILSFTLPLLVATAFYSMIGYRVWFRPLLGAGSSVTAIQRSKVKALKMIIAVLMLFAICWFPLHIFIVCLYFLPMDKGNDALVASAFYIKWLALSNSAVNPIVYYLFSKKYRSGFRSVCSSCKYPKAVGQSTISRSQGMAKKQVLYRSQTAANRASSAGGDDPNSKKRLYNSEGMYKEGMELISVGNLEKLK